MANLLGEPFEKYVNSQIDSRQKIHGKKEGRSSSEIAYLNSTNAWIKLASGTSMSEERLGILKENGNKMLTGVKAGKDLAMKNVLFNGLSAYGESWDTDKIKKEKEETGMNFSVANLEKSSPKISNRFRKYSKPQNYTGIGNKGQVAYGLDGTDFGYSPMPGITNLSVKDLNRGSIKKATLNIKANNRNQLEVIDALYMRLGYTVLLEWGHNQYWDDTQGKLTSQPASLIDTIFFRDIYNKSDYSQFLPKILSQRELTRGNYDAMFGTVSNFSWTFESDGSYNISIEIISLGDIVESLGISVSTVRGSLNAPNPIIKELLPKFEKKAAENQVEFYRDLYPTLQASLKTFYDTNINAISNNPIDYPIAKDNEYPGGGYLPFPAFINSKSNDPQIKGGVEKFNSSYKFINPQVTSTVEDEIRQKNNIDTIMSTQNPGREILGKFFYAEIKKYLEDNKTISLKIKSVNKVGTVTEKPTVVSQLELNPEFKSSLVPDGGTDAAPTYSYVEFKGNKFGEFKFNWNMVNGTIGVKGYTVNNAINTLYAKKPIGFNQLCQKLTNTDIIGGTEGLGLLFTSLNKKILTNVVTFESFLTYVYQQFSAKNLAGGTSDPRFQPTSTGEPPVDPNAGANQISELQSKALEKSVRGNIFKYFYSIRYFYEPIAVPSAESVKDSKSWFGSWFDSVPLNDIAKFQGLDSMAAVKCYKSDTVGRVLNPFNRSGGTSDEVTKWNKEVNYPIYKLTPEKDRIKAESKKTSTPVNYVEIKDTNEVATQKMIETMSNINANIAPGYTSNVYTSYGKNNKSLNTPDDLGVDFFKLYSTNLFDSFYIRLGTLLAYIRDKSIPEIDSKGKQPLIDIDVNIGLNICYTVDNSISLDPTKLIINNPQFTNGGKEKQSVFSGINNFVTSNEKGTYGNIMNVYFNFSRIEQILEDLMSKDGKVILFDFVDQLCKDINLSLGGVNNLEPNIDENTNTIRIIDQTNIPNIENIFTSAFDRQSTVLEVFGYNPNTKMSNFVHKIGLQTKISKEYATMITIGATSKGAVPGAEATAFSKWNIGITDRFKNNLTDPNSEDIGDKTSEKQLEEDNEEIIKNYATNIQRPYPILGFEGDEKDGNKYLTFNNEFIKNNLKVCKDFYIYEQALSSINNLEDDIIETSIGFIPFNLSIDLEGISGMKIYNRLKVNTSFLPSNYDKTLDFIITGVNHSISGNVWKTSLSSLATSKSVLTK